ncbi:MAG TPA: SgcJ/EcaC family oxidoreductase [Ktedonobacteraceae bacterium]
MSTQSAREQSMHAADEEAVRALYQHLLETWNQRDADAMAALFAVDGVIIGFDGSQNAGQAEIASTTRQIFAAHLTHTYVGKIRDVRFLAANVALLRAVVGFIAPGQTDLNAALNAVQTLVAVKYSNEWRVELFQNTPAQFHGRPDLAQQLTDELRALL